MDVNRPIQQVDYAGVKYSLFDNFQCFVKEVERSRKAILKTNFDSIASQVHDLIRIIEKLFGSYSEEAHAVTESPMFCTQCGCPFSAYFRMAILMPAVKLPGPKISFECPGCKSKEILYLYRVVSDTIQVTKADILNMRKYFKYVATVWWQNRPESKICDNCFVPVAHGEGYICGITDGKMVRADELLCEGCVTKFLDDPELLKSLQRNPNNMGNGLIWKVREYVKEKNNY